MNQNSTNHSLDSSSDQFSPFALGLAIGVIGTLLLGTEEGRDTAKKVITTVLETLKPTTPPLEPPKLESANPDPFLPPDHF